MALILTPSNGAVTKLKDSLCVRLFLYATFTKGYFRFVIMLMYISRCIM